MTPTQKARHVRSNHVSDANAQRGVAKDDLRDASSRDAQTSAGAQIQRLAVVESASGAVHRGRAGARRDPQRDSRRDRLRGDSSHGRVDQETRDLRIEVHLTAAESDRSIAMLQARARTQPVVVHSTEAVVVTGTTLGVDRVSAHLVADRIRVESDRVVQAHRSADNAISTATPITCTAQSRRRTSSIVRILRVEAPVVVDLHAQEDLDDRRIVGHSDVRLGRK